MTITTISTITLLQSAIKAAKSGDSIIIANNTYISDNTIYISCNGVVIRAETSGGVLFQGGSISFIISGSNNTFTGIQFISGSTVATRPVDVIQIRGSNNIICDINFNGFLAQHYINIYNGCQYNTIKNCNIQGKPVSSVINGSQIEVQADPRIIGYHTISHCSFQAMIGSCGDFGNEPIRLGEGSMSSFDLGTVVEYCVFDNTQGADSESVSVKSQRNVIRYCTFRNQQKAMLSFRNGNYNIAYGNFFINAGGIRVKQASNIYCYNNYFENCNNSMIYVDVSMYPDPPSYQNNIVFQNNTYYNCGTIQLGNSTINTSNSFLNNILFNSSSNVPLYAGSNSSIVWNGNMYCGVFSLPVPVGNFEKNLCLVLNSDGYYSIGDNSPAIGGSSASQLPNLNISAINTDDNIVLDITGKPRLNSKSVGCNESFSSNRINIPLNTTNTGPSYLVSSSSATF